MTIKSTQTPPGKDNGQFMMGFQSWYCQRFRLENTLLWRGGHPVQWPPKLSLTEAICPPAEGSQSGSLGSPWSSFTITKKTIKCLSSFGEEEVWQSCCCLSAQESPTTNGRLRQHWAAGSHVHSEAVTVLGSQHIHTRQVPWKWGNPSKPDISICTSLTSHLWLLPHFWILPQRGAPGGGDESYPELLD